MRPPSGTGACRTHHHCVVLMGAGYSGLHPSPEGGNQSQVIRWRAARWSLTTSPWSLILRIRRWREEAAPASVRPLAAPEGAVGRRLGFRERHRLHLEEMITIRSQTDALARNDETVAFAAAPFAGAVAQAAA